MEVGLQMRPIPGFDGYYVTDAGRIWSTRPWRGHPGGRWPRSRPRSRSEHLSIHLYVNGKQTVHQVHSVVAMAFLGPRPEGREVRHLNGDPTYGTKSENNLDRVRHGTHHYARRTHCKWGHLYDEANTYLPPGGGRVCRTCGRKGVRSEAKRKAG